MPALTTPYPMRGAPKMWPRTATETRGTYCFKFQPKVSIDSWKTPLVKSTGSCIVVVEQPPESTSMRPGTGVSHGGALKIRL